MRRPHFLIGLVCLLAVGAAVFAQYQLDMQPCPWCILQRVIFLLVALVSLTSALGPLLTAKAGAGMVAGLSLAGFAAALYQNLVAAKSASCNLSLAEQMLSGLGLDALWPEVFEIRASCADAAAQLLGLPYEAWSGLLFVVLAILSVALAARKPSRR